MIAGNFRKSIAHFIDIFVIGLLIVGSLYAILTGQFNFGENNNYGFNLTGIHFGIWLGLVIFYLVWCERKFQKTVGGKLLGLTVTNQQGKTPTVKQLFIRHIGRIFDILLFMTPLFSPTKQRFSDMGAGTFVLRSSHLPLKETIEIKKWGRTRKILFGVAHIVLILSFIFLVGHVSISTSNKIDTLNTSSQREQKFLKITSEAIETNNYEHLYESTSSVYKEEVSREDFRKKMENPIIMHAASGIENIQTIQTYPNQKFQETAFWVKNDKGVISQAFVIFDEKGWIDIHFKIIDAPEAIINKIQQALEAQNNGNY